MTEQFICIDDNGYAGYGETVARALDSYRTFHGYDVRGEELSFFKATPIRVEVKEVVVYKE